jgi:DNA anti-recombination protein RmuC
MEGSLAKIQAENAKLSEELVQKSESFKQEKKYLQTKYEAEANKNTKLQQSLKELRDKCLNFGNRCIQRLKRVFNSVGASSEKFTPSAEDIPVGGLRLPKVLKNMI